ncbi:hypothetical protein Btru_042001 [Bulinus truncatus]|nr:hypothetical protein Btru_042001 [Bulinus truncatus]
MIIAFLIFNGIFFYFVIHSTRTKRQSADVRTAEYLAWIALGGRVPSRGCEIVACGVVDVHSSGKKKRDPQLSDEERYSLLKALIQRAAQENSSL